jgi:hypothetical protein
MSKGTSKTCPTSGLVCHTEVGQNRRSHLAIDGAVRRNLHFQSPPAAGSAAPCRCMVGRWPAASGSDIAEATFQAARIYALHLVECECLSSSSMRAQANQ